MAWVVDTCILLDIGLDDPRFGESSERLLIGKSAEGLVICPVTFVELAPAFNGETRILEEFLVGLGVDYLRDWAWEDTLRAQAAWSVYVRKRRSGKLGKRPMADILIGAYAIRFDGLLTRNRPDFAGLHEALTILEPR